MKMNLRHVTPSHNLESILKQGLDPVYTLTPSVSKYVRLHTPRQTPWAVRHTSRRKQVSEDEVVILEVSVPRSWLSRAWPGVWKCPRVIPPDRLRVLNEAVRG